MGTRNSLQNMSEPLAKRRRLTEAVDEIEQENAKLEQENTKLEQEKAKLEQEKAKLEQEKAKLSATVEMVTTNGQLEDELVEKLLAFRGENKRNDQMGIDLKGTVGHLDRRMAIAFEGYKSEWNRPSDGILGCIGEFQQKRIDLVPRFFSTKNEGVKSLFKCILCDKATNVQFKQRMEFIDGTSNLICALWKRMLAMIVYLPQNKESDRQAAMHCIRALRRADMCPEEFVFSGCIALAKGEMFP